MKEIRSFLAVIPAMMQPHQVSNLVNNAMVLGQWLKCEVHFFVHPSLVGRFEVAEADFRRSQSKLPSKLIIHSSADATSAGALQVLEKYSCDFVLMQDGILSDDTRGVDERILLEKSPIPVFLIPRGTDFTKQPPNAILAPLSGEQTTSEAATTALILARQTGSPLDFLHVADPTGSCACGQNMEILADELHHEYSHLVEKVVSEASPYSSPEERSRIRHFHQSRGLATEEIIKILEQSPGSILVLEWKGTLAEGRAEIVKDLLKKSRNAILFVKSVQEKKSILRVGKNIRAAS